MKQIGLFTERKKESQKSDNLKKNKKVLDKRLRDMIHLASSVWLHSSVGSLRAGSLVWVPRTGKARKGVWEAPILLASTRLRLPIQTSEPARRLLSW